MEIREDFSSVSEYLEQLASYGDVFEENNLNYWPNLKNNEDRYTK